MWYPHGMRRVSLVKRRVGNEGGFTGWEVRDAWVETSIGDGWMAAFRVFEREGVLVVGELRVLPEEPDTGDPKSRGYWLSGERAPGSWSAENLGDRALIPPGGLTARKARKAPFEAVRQAVRELLARLRIEEGEVEQLFGPAGLLAERRWTPETYRRSPRGRRPKDDRALAEIAAVYVSHAGSRTQLDDTARERKSSPQYTKRLLKQARDRGLLGNPPGRGRAGGELTDRAKALLQEQHEREEGQHG